MYDSYINHDEIPTLAMTSLLGNHDNWSQGNHYQHFNEPNYTKNPSTGTYYGLTQTNGNINGADYWFTYNSVLFVVLNTNTMTTSWGGVLTPAEAKKAADEHIAFINHVLEVNKENVEIQWKVLVYHHSPYGASYHNNYTQDENGEYTARPEQNTFIYMREYLLPAVYDADFDVVFSGHDHVYTRSHILRHDPVNTDGAYYGNETATALLNTSGKNHYTYANGTTTPSFVNWTDVNGMVHTDKKITYAPVKVTDPDGVLHISGGSARVRHSRNFLT